MQFDLVTPEKLLFSGEAEHVIVTGTEGSMGILEGHQPLISDLVPSDLTVINGETKTIYTVGTGFVDIGESKVTVLTDIAEVKK